MKASTAAVLSLCLGGCSMPGNQHAMTAASAPRTQVELWTGGDDGLTQRLADAVREEFRMSGRFLLIEAGGTPEALKVIIPTHVGWQEVGKRTRVTYLLELESRGRRSAARGGSCWETKLAQCAQQVVRTVAAAGN